MSPNILGSLLCTAFFLSARNGTNQNYVKLNLRRHRIVHTANIFEAIFTVFNCVLISTVISLYGLHLIAAPSTVK